MILSLPSELLERVAACLDASDAARAAAASTGMRATFGPACSKKIDDMTAEMVDMMTAAREAGDIAGGLVERLRTVRTAFDPGFVDDDGEVYEDTVEEYYDFSDDECEDTIHDAVFEHVCERWPVDSVQSTREHHEGKRIRALYAISASWHGLIVHFDVVVHPADGGGVHGGVCFFDEEDEDDCFFHDSTNYVPNTAAKVAFVRAWGISEDLFFEKRM